MSSPSISTTRHQAERIATGRLWRTGLLAAVLAAILGVVIRTIGVIVGAVSSSYQGLQPAPIIVVSVFAALVGTGILAALARWARRPMRTFRIIAIVALILSFSGPLQAGAGAMPGYAANGATVVIMLLMHVAAAAVIVGLLTTLGRAPRREE